MHTIAKKRRYSSIAVEFPIRNDLSAHSQGISSMFPSWERAHRAPAYVHGRENDVISTESHLPWSITPPTILPANAAYTPCGLLKSVYISTNERPTKSIYAAHTTLKNLSRMVCESIRVHLGVTCRC